MKVLEGSKPISARQMLPGPSLTPRFQPFILRHCSLRETFVSVRTPQAFAVI